METQRKWDTNKLLERRKELMVEAKGRLFPVDDIDESQRKRGRNKIFSQRVSESVAQTIRRAPEASGSLPQGGWHRGAQSAPPLQSNLFLARMEEPDASGRLPQEGWRSEAQSEPQLQNRLGGPACRMCGNVRCGDFHVIYLGPFWHDVAVPGLEGLASRIMGEVEYIKICQTCTQKLLRICEEQMREIGESREMREILEKSKRDHGEIFTCLDASLQLLDKVHVLILAQLRRQCANLLPRTLVVFNCF